MNLIDIREKPCDVCAAHVAGHCDCCGAEIPVLPNMGGAGYQSPRPSHEHLKAMGSLVSKEVAYDELCPDCYRNAYVTAYPDKPCPI